MNALRYLHVDVFAARPYAGNSLPVFMDAPDLTTEQMLAITRELRHFEAIFLAETSTPGTYRARIFDLFAELPFAGHPIIGAACALHCHGHPEEERHWIFELAERTVSVVTRRAATGFAAMLDQGEAVFLGECDDRDDVAAAFDLDPSDLHPQLPMVVVSTGLRYLIVPVLPGALEKARIRTDISALVKRAGAQFAVLLDEAALEIRHWNNDGIVEDVATGSAAGTVGAYRMRYCGARSGEIFALNQGRFAGRPSLIDVKPRGTADAVHSVLVGGKVAIVGHGVLEVLP
jgi:PhzF family phenazine biosynthesis protein